MKAFLQMEMKTKIDLDLVEPRIVEDIDAALVDEDRAVTFGGGEGRSVCRNARGDLVLQSSSERRREVEFPALISHLLVSVRGKRYQSRTPI